jgi:hypothetical protein
MRVNVGGDPGRDDYGLPPVDVEIPDDARELDRDVQAYYRELRVLRRRTRARRLCQPLSRDGMVLPLLAGCLALTLIAGTLLTVFAAGPPPQQSTSGAAGRGATARGKNPPRTAGHGTGQAAHAVAPRNPQQGKAGAPLPAAVVDVAGQPVSMDSLAGPVLVLALVPPGCRCLPGVRQLVVQARRFGADPYLVGSDGTLLMALSRQVALGPAHAVTDSRYTLPAAYHPAALTAVVVRQDGRVVAFVPDPARGSQLRTALRGLLAQPPAKP